MGEDNLNKSSHRQLTTPERMRMVESIKKSIHRSIQKINPTEYKSILKGQNIFIYLSYKGQVINSQYTKVALFMGAAIYKIAIQKITIVITNDLSNNSVKKLKTMGKPILNVLWLEACFQEKKKVPFDNFFYSDDKKGEIIEEDNDEQVSNVNFDRLANTQKNRMEGILNKFKRNYENKIIKIVDKKDKGHNKGWTVLTAREIQIGQQRRKSMSINEKPSKRGIKKKNQIKSQGNDKNSKCQDVETAQLESLTSQQQLQNRHKNSESGKDSTEQIFQKYLKEYDAFQKNIVTKDDGCDTILELNEQSQTPCFINYDHDHKDIQVINQKYKQCQQIIKTPSKLSLVHDSDQLMQTYSIKKVSKHTKNIPFKIIVPHPILASKISTINKIRQSEFVPQIQIVSSNVKDQIWVIKKNSQSQPLYAILSRPKMIVNEGFVQFLQNNPLVELDEKNLAHYEVKYTINYKNIRGKYVVLLDSVIGSQSLEEIIKFLGGKVLNLTDFLFDKSKVDFVISNKKSYLKSEKQNYQVLTQTKFLDLLLEFQR